MTAPPLIQLPLVWHCDANHITCGHGQPHLLRFVDTDFIVDQRRIDGHLFFGCRKEEPTCYFFGVVNSRPSPMVTCYRISKEQFQQWHNVPYDEVDPMPTPEMLFRLGHNPYWRKPR